MNSNTVVNNDKIIDFDFHEKYAWVDALLEHHVKNDTNIDFDEKYAWVDALLEHHALQEQRHYEEESLMDIIEDDDDEDEAEEEDDEDDIDDIYSSLQHVDFTAVGLGLVNEEDTSGLISELSEAQDDELYQHKRQKVDNDLAMDLCFDSDEDEDEDNDLLDENDPLLPQCLFPEGRTYEVDADEDIIIERLPSGNTLVFNSDLFLSPPPPLRAQYTSYVGENGYIVYNSKHGNQYYDEDPVEEEDEEEPDYSSMPELVCDNSSDDEDDEIIT